MGVIIPFSGGIVKRLSVFHSVEAVMMRWGDEVLLPGTRSIATRFKAAHGKAWMRPADGHKCVKHQVQVIRISLGPFNEAIVRWREEVLFPKLKSIAGRMKEMLYRLKGS